MAVDTQNKRASAANLPWNFICPQPDSDVTSEDRKQVTGEYAFGSWISPDDHYDVTDTWDDETKAYDSNTGTFAIESDWDDSDELEFTFNSYFWIEKFRIYGRMEDEGAGEYDLDFVLSVHYGGQYYSVYDGTMAKNEWVEYPCCVPAVRTNRIKILSNVANAKKLKIYEIQCFDVSNSVIRPPRPKTSGSLIGNPLISHGLVR